MLQMCVLDDAKTTGATEALEAEEVIVLILIYYGYGR